MIHHNDPILDNSPKDNGSVEIIYQLSKIWTKSDPEQPRRIIAKAFTVTFPDHQFEFLPDDHHTFKYIRLTWQIGDSKPFYMTYEVTGEDNDDISKVAYQILLEKATELDKDDDNDQYPVVHRRRRRRVVRE